MFLILIAKGKKKRMFYNGLFGKFQEALDLCCLFEYKEEYRKELEKVLRKYKAKNEKVNFELLSIDLEKII